MTKKWDIESMPVYRDALELVEIGEEVALRVSGRRPDLADNLRRSSLSVLLNIREGATEYAPRDKARIYRIAKREAGECAAAFDAIRVLRLACKRSERGLALSRSIAAQLTGLVRAALDRADQT